MVAKGADYQVGQPQTGQAANHVWNAVCIDDSWGLVDTCWGRATCLHHQESL